MKKNSVVDTRGLKASKKPKQFGDLRFDYIRSCKHEYGNSDSRNAAVAEGYVSCPFCKLINSTTQKFFAQEIKSRRVEREKSVLARAKLRLSLLLGWSRCHSSCYTSKDFTPSVDIVVSKSLAEWTVSADKAYLLALIGSRSSSYQTRSVRNSSSIYHTNTTNNTNSLTNNTNNNIDYREAYRLLQRKKRVKEVGNFAALFLQSRIRKVITKRKLRKLLLQRFEYVPPTRKKDAFFVDTKKNRKWQSLPAIMHDEAPGTPRTISRRMNMEQRKAEKKYYNYYSSVKRLFMSNQSYLRMLYGNQNLVKSYNQTAARISDGSHFAKEFSLDQVSSELLSRVLLLEEEKVIKFLKQVVLLRDLAEMAMREMTNWRRPTTGSGVSLLSQDQRSNTVEEEYLPVWMSLTTPASAPRAVGLAMALGTQPIAPPETPIHQQKSFIVTEENGKITVLDDVKNVNSNGEERGTNKKSQDINRAFQILEQRIWSCMRCNNPEQVVQMFFHEEFEPVVESVLNIAQDDRNIYDGRIDRGDSTEKYVAVENTKATSTVAESGKMNKNIDLTARNGRETANRCEVLPLAIQLHPFYAERNPNGFFKLFFYNEECIAVTQLSPWAHYPEIQKHKETVLTAIKSFLQSTSLRAFAKRYYAKAQADHGNPKLKVSVERQGKSEKGKRIGPPPMRPDQLNNGGKGNRYALFVPNENEIFGQAHWGAQDADKYAESSPINFSDLNDVKTLYLHNKYRFIRRLSKFNDRHKRAFAGAKTGKKKNSLLATNTDICADPLKSKTLVVIESDEATAATLEDIREIISWNQLEGNQIYDAIYDMSDSLFGLTNVNAQSNVNTLAQSTALIVKSDADSLSVSDSVSALGNGSIITARIGENEEEMTYEYDLDNPPVLSGYAKKLRKCSNQVDTDIAPRLIVPDDIELDSTSFQLLVIDVHITLPRATGLQQGRGVASLNTARSVSSRGSSMTGITPRTALDVDNCEENLTARSRISEGTAASGHISISKYSSKPNTPATIGDNSSFPDPSNDFVVDIHQVVGIFSLDNEKEPPNLDFGLFSWNYFRDYHMEQKAMYSNKQRTNVNSPTNAKQQAQNIPPINTKERIFSYPNQTTGVSTHKSTLASGREFKFLILGQAPTKQHLSEDVPERVKKWIGIKD